MIRITCPCCSQKYELEDEEIEENLRFFCWNCNKKLIYVRGKVIPFALEQPAQDGSRKIRCPFCAGKNPMDEDDTGVFLCRNCGQSFYVLPSNGVPPPLPSELAQEETVPSAGRELQGSEQPSNPVSPSAPTESFTPSPASVRPTPQAGGSIGVPPLPITGKIPDIPAPETSAPPQNLRRVNKLLDFSTDNREMFFSGGGTKIKVGLPRPRSGISGFFIGISEALCGKR